MSWLKKLFGGGGNVKEGTVSEATDTEERRQVVAEVPESTDVLAVDTAEMEQYLVVLDEEEEERQDAVAEVPEDSGSPTVETHIIALKEWEKRQAAVEALVKIGEPAVTPLIAAMHDLNAEARGADLGFINLANARNAAIEALSEIGDVRAIDPILSVVRDKESQLSAADLQKTIADALAKFGTPAVEALVAVMQDQDDDFRARWAAAKALAKIGDERTVEPFIAALKDENKEVREGAAEGLARIGDPRAVEPLIAALRDNPGHKNAYVRIFAAEGLAEIGDARGVEPLIAALGTDDNEFVRSAVAKALDRLNVPRRKPAPSIRRVEQMTMVHYALMGYSNAKLTEFADQAAVGGSIKLKVPIGDVAELADGIGILVDCIESFREVEIGIDLLDWAVAVTDAMDKGTAATAGANHQAALEYWKKAYEMAPGYPLVLMSLGVSYAYCGDASSAIKYLEKAHRLAPKNQRIKANLEGIKRDLL